METDIDYPDGLPLPQRQGYGIKHVSPFVRTPMHSGRGRSRRVNTTVPSEVPVQWLMSAVQAQLFEVWFRDSISDGVDWFNIRMKTPLSLERYMCQFDDMYTGPILVGVNSWRFTATLWIWERPLLPPGAGLIPGDILNPELLDLTINKEWPEP